MQRSWGPGVFRRPGVWGFRAWGLGFRALGLGLRVGVL